MCSVKNKRPKRERKWFRYTCEDGNLQFAAFAATFRAPKTPPARVCVGAEDVTPRLRHFRSRASYTNAVSEKRVLRGTLLLFAKQTKKGEKEHPKQDALEINGQGETAGRREPKERDRERGGNEIKVKK